MGRAIFYCVQCSRRVSESDLDAGTAFRIGERILCGDCAPPGTKPTSSRKIPAVARKPGGTSVATRAVPPPSEPPPPPPDETGGRRRLLLIGGAVAAVLLVGAVVVLLLRGDAPRPPALADQNPTVQPTLPAKSGEKPTENPADAKEASARVDLEKAKAFARSRPGDHSGQLREFNDVVWKWDGTAAAREAAKESAAVKAAILEKVGAWMTDLEAQIKGLVESKQYVAAVRKIEELKAAHDLPEWRLAAEKRASELYQIGKQIADAEEAKKPENSPAVPGESKKTVTEEARAYLAAWEAAAAKATARDYGGAAAALEQAAPALKEAAVRQDAESDVVLFRKIGAVHKAGMEFLSQRPRGGGIGVVVRDGKGEAKRISGQVLQIDAERVEIRTGKSSEFVEWADVTAATFAEIAQQRTFEPAVLAALCLLEGEREAARALGAELPPKWWTYAETALAKLPKPEPSERNARDLYVVAEKGFRSMDTFAAAVENYRTLRADFAATALVKKYSERIFRRSDAGREYYFGPADFRAEGTFQTGRSGKLESMRDSDDRDTLQNLAEIEFAVLPGLAYRCWLQVGACCEETFFFYYQGSDLAETDAKTKKKIACEPGSPYAVPVKHSLRNLKKTHDDHKVKGAKVHPKTPARWEWIEIVLPKYAGPGPRKLRFMTNQAGFSIGGACVSSTRKAFPPEAEIRELEKLRALENPPMPVDPDLVGWWTFDEGSGDQTNDLTGKNHTGKFAGVVQWTAGKIGGGIQTGGEKSGVQVADAEDLRIAGDLTLALWVNRTTESDDWVCLLGRGTSEQRNYGLWLEPRTRKVLFQQYGAASVNILGKTLFDDGQWVHLAATSEGAAIKLYYNGQLDVEGVKSGAASTVPAPLGIGHAMHHKGLIGMLDDVRVYRRALSPEEIRALYLSGR